MKVGVVNKKGGVGKTTLTMALGHESAIRGNKTLLIDADPSQGIIIWRNKRMKQNIDLHPMLTIFSMPSNSIHKDIDRLSIGYDNVFIDSPPLDNFISNSVMMASDFVLIPCVPCDGDLSLSGRTWLQFIDDATTFNKMLKGGIVVNRKESNTVIGASLRRDIMDALPDASVLKIEINKRIVFAESFQGKSIHEIDKDGRAITEVGQLYDEIVSILSEGEKK